MSEKDGKTWLDVWGEWKHDSFDQILSRYLDLFEDDEWQEEYEGEITL